MIETIRAGDLDVAYLDVGPSNGAPVILLHGFPYDVWAYDEVMSLLAEEGCRVIVPYLRGYGPTRFVSATTMRSTVPSPCLARMRPIFLAARSVKMTLFGARAASVITYLSAARHGAALETKSNIVRRR